MSEGESSILHWCFNTSKHTRLKKQAFEYGVCFIMFQDSTWKQFEAHSRILQIPVEGKKSVKTEMTEEVVAEVDWCSHGGKEREIESSSLSFSSLYSLCLVWQLSVDSLSICLAPQLTDRQNTLFLKQLSPKERNNEFHYFNHQCNCNKKKKQNATGHWSQYSHELNVISMPLVATNRIAKNHTYRVMYHSELSW